MSRIDILNTFEQEPQSLDFMLPSFLAGTVGALQACMSIACAVAGGDLLGLESKSGLVVYINAEKSSLETAFLRLVKS